MPSVRDGQEVMLKVLSYKDEGAGEVDILTYLSSEPVKSEIDNPIVSLLELLHHGNWTFAVQPRWSACVNPEFQTVGEGLEFCVQVTKVSFPSSKYYTVADLFKGCRVFASSPCCTSGL
jgi:hypothetical protein